MIRLLKMSLWGFQIFIIINFISCAANMGVKEVAKNIRHINVEKEYVNEGTTYYVADLRYLSKYGVNIQSSYSDITDFEAFSQNTVVIEFIDSEEKGPSNHQLKTLEQFLYSEEKIAIDVGKNIYSYYEDVYPDYYEGASSIDDDPSSIEMFLPKIVNGNELDNLIKLNSILMHPCIDNVCRVGLNFYCSWDEEHGLGILIKNNKVVQTGFADTAYPF